MAQIKFLRGVNVTTNPDYPEIKDGQVLFATGDKAVYIDVGTIRTKIAINSDDSIKAIEAKLAGLTEATVVAEIAAEIAKLKKSVITEGEAGNNGVEVNITDTADASSKKITVKTKISSKEDNQVSIETEAGKEGLYVPAPAAPDTYEIEKLADTDVDTTQYAAAYRLIKKANGTGTATQVGATINIIKDNFINEVTLVDTDGTTAGKYIKITFKDSNTSTIYLDVKELFNVYTGAAADDGIITVSVNATTGIITATIADGSVTKEKLETSVQTSLNLADNAVQPNELASAVVTNEYISGIEVSDDGTIDIKKAALPSLDALEWGSFNTTPPEA